MTKQYHNTEYIGRKVLASLSSESVHVGYTRDERKLTNISPVFTHHGSIQQIVKQFTATYVLIPVNGFYPSELDIEVANYSESTTIRLLPLPYAYFVLFLCAYHRRDATIMHELLGTLESLICDEHHGLCPGDSCRFIILNMVGISYELLGDLQKASFYYMKRTDNNDHPHAKAAYVRLELLQNIKIINTLKLLLNRAFVDLCLTYETLRDVYDNLRIYMQRDA